MYSAIMQTIETDPHFDHMRWKLVEKIALKYYLSFVGNFLMYLICVYVLYGLIGAIGIGVWGIKENPFFSNINIYYVTCIPVGVTLFITILFSIYRPRSREFSVAFDVEGNQVYFLLKYSYLFGSEENKYWVFKQPQNIFALIRKDNKIYLYVKEIDGNFKKYSIDLKQFIFDIELKNETNLARWYNLIGQYLEEFSKSKIKRIEYENLREVNKQKVNLSE